MNINELIETLLKLKLKSNKKVSNINISEVGIDSGFDATLIEIINRDGTKTITQIVKN